MVTIESVIPIRLQVSVSLLRVVAILTYRVESMSVTRMRSEIARNSPAIKKKALSAPRVVPLRDLPLRRLSLLLLGVQRL